MNSAVEIQAYHNGFMDGLRKGRSDAVVMKEDADGCTGCAFEKVESWQQPCAMCKRNCKDYWRSKAMEL